MLSKFKITNFRSIRELTVDMSYGEGKAPNGYRNTDRLYFLEQNRKRFVPVLAFFGANAAGKTNIIKALRRFHDFVVEGRRPNVLSFDPNRLNAPTETTAFEIECILDGEIFLYSMAYDGKYIRSEKLSCNGGELFSIEDGKGSFSKISTPLYSQEKLEEIYGTECCVDRQVKSDRQIRTFLHTLGTNFAGLNKKVLRLYHFFESGIVILGGNDVPLKFGIDFLTEFFSQEKKENPQQLAFDTIATGLKKLDIDIKGMISRHHKSVIPLQGDIVPAALIDIIKQNAEKIEEKDGKLIVTSNRMISQHRDINDNLVDFDFQQAESMGTQILAGLLGIIFRAIREGCVVVVDELDRSLHPFLLSALVNLFKNRDHNIKKKAQILFTLHDVYLLEKNQLRVSEIGIVEKNLRKGTTLMRLCEDKTLRNISNFKQLYLSGAYGGIPFPYL